MTVEPVHCEHHAFKKLGWSLRGKGLIRFSNALFKKATAPDVLGCSLAFCDDEGKAEQHLLLATIQRPWTLALAPFSTDTHDYLGNDYFGVSPFKAGGDETFYVSLRRDGAQPTARADVDRTELFAAQVATHRHLLLACSESPRGPWTPMARVTLEEVVAEDPSMEFDPFLDGRGLQPVGFIHALRKGAYAGSRRGREQAQGFATHPAEARQGTSICSE